MKGSAMYVDICNSADEAAFAVKYHKAKNHVKVKKTKAQDDAIVVSKLEGTSPDFKRKGIFFETGPGVWIVTAEDA